MLSTQPILGISFFNGKVGTVFQHLYQNGGLLTVPAAPALVTIKEDTAYYEALLSSDIVIPDSGYMVLVWNIFNRNRISKISGLEFINYFIENRNQIKSDTFFLINPSEIDSKINSEYLIEKGLNILPENSYTAPFYKEIIEDQNLISMIENQKPKWIIINIGGGTQEKLGLYIKNALSYSPAIVCSGAALAFKTGRQANIPKLIDQLYLGWLFRIFSNPKLFIPRYLKGFKLINLLLNYKSNKVQ